MGADVVHDLSQGTMLVADNVVKPGNPAYLSWVRATPAQKRHSLQSPHLTSQPTTKPHPTSDEDWQKSFYDGPLDETRWAPAEAEGITAEGDPNLVYTSEMVGGWDPYTGERDACEVSICTGRED
jgi:catechol O-methyltransferase